MSFGFNSQISKEKDKSKYEIQITTDNYEQFLFIQEMARECVDGKHKEKKGDTETFAEHYGCKPSTLEEFTTLPTQALNDIPDCCKGCSNHPSNGGSGICNCTAPYFEKTYYYSTCSSI